MTHIEWTPKQAAVLDLLLQGKANGEIAAELGMTKGMVRSLIERMCVKTGTKGRYKLIVFAWRNRLKANDLKYTKPPGI